MTLAAIIAYVGFCLAAYSVIGNDVIQTLGTFLSSNKNRKWWVLWLFAGSILSAALIYGWYVNSGDVSYGRLTEIPLPEPLQWWYLLPPIVLLLITVFGIPVSTTFMILSVFSTGQVIEKMVLKSVFGYALAFASAYVIYLLIARQFETKLSLSEMEEKKKVRYWTVAQWFSTAFLWSQWLIQDFANIYVYLPRQLTFPELMASLVVILLMLAFIFKRRGGKIQKVVSKKANIENIRSATIVDLCYGGLLLFFTEINTIPMSTTWMFMGILAGREVAIQYLLKEQSAEITYRNIIKDFAKVNAGLVISILIAYGISFLKT